MEALLLLLASLAPQAPADTVTVEAVLGSYAEAFPIRTQVAGQDTIVAVILPKEFPPGNPLGGFHEENGYFLTFLVTHAPLFDQGGVLYGSAPIPERTRTYHAALRSDRRFNAAVLTTLGRYLQAQGGSLVGYRAPDALVEISPEDLQALAARFFFPDGVRPDGTLSAHICVGLNGLEDLDVNRDLLTEAFVYAAIFRELRDPQYGVLEEFEEAMELASKLKLSSDPDTRVTRAQGVVWGILSQSERLRSLLVDSYEARKAYAPFRLVR